MYTKVNIIGILFIIFSGLLIFSTTSQAQNVTNTTTSPSPSSTPTYTPTITPIGTTTCANGPIPGNGACMCSGVSYNTGYCCNGVYSTSTPCSTNAPQCSEGAVPSSGCLCSGYAYITGNCCYSYLGNSLVWSGNYPCTQTCPTIAKSVSSSYSGVCCAGSVSDCKGTWSGQWGVDCQGFTCCIGTAQPLCTGSAYGIGAPTPTPTPTPIPGAGAPEPSNNDPGVWAQVEVSTGQITSTSVCTKSVCGLNGEYHGYVPPSSYSPGSVWWPTSKRYIWQMQGQAGYSSGTFNFNNYVFTVQGGTIYNGQFTSASTTSAGSTSNQTNYTYPQSTQSPNYTSSVYTPTPAISSTPVYSTIPIPNQTEPAYVPLPKPSTSCNTDQDCLWQINNGCSESAGASWSCTSLLYPIQKIQSSFCPQALSPRPSANCGCVQKNCIVFENERPVEAPKKIGNTEVDTTSLLSVVIQMEQLKIKFDFLKSAMVKLSKYYNATGKYDASSRWSDAWKMLDNAIYKLESLKDGIRAKISTTTFTIDDLRQLKKDVKSVIGTLRDIVKVILGGSVTINAPPSVQPRSPANETNQTNATSGGGSAGLNQTMPQIPSNTTSNQTNSTNQTSIGGGLGQGNSTNRTNSTS